MTDYFCRNCDASVRPDDKTSPNCDVDLFQVGRKIVAVMEEGVSVSDEVILSVFELV